MLGNGPTRLTMDDTRIILTAMEKPPLLGEILCRLIAALAVLSVASLGLVWMSQAFDSLAVDDQLEDQTLISPVSPQPSGLTALPPAPFYFSDTSRSLLFSSANPFSTG